VYKIEKKPYGYRLTFADSISPDEMNAWVDESKKVLVTSPTKFGIFVDMRTLRPLANEARHIMENGQKLYKQNGMERSVVILSSNLTKIQFKNIARDTGIYAFERYIDASSEPGWEQIGIKWITEGIDPDK